MTYVASSRLQVQLTVNSVLNLNIVYSGLLHRADNKQSNLCSFHG